MNKNNIPFRVVIALLTIVFGVTLSFASLVNAERTSTNGNWLTNGTNTYYAAGSVGIGTSSPQALLEIASSSPGLTANILNLLNPSSATSSASSFTFRTNDLINGTSTAGISGILTKNFNGGTGNLTLSTLRSGVLTEAVRVVDTGRVGIGTTTPAQTLDVVGNIQLEGLANTSVIIDPYGAGTDVASIQFVGARVSTGFDGTAAYLSGAGAKDVVLKPNNGSGVLWAKVSGGVSIGQVTLPIQDSLLVATSSPNATTTIEFGKTGQNKGTCMTFYRTDGSVIYGYIPAGSTAWTLTTTNCTS